MKDLFLITEPFHYSLICNLYKEVLTLPLLEERMKFSKIP